MSKNDRKKHSEEMGKLHGLYVQVLKDILTGMDFAESETGYKASFIKDDINLAWLFDFRDLKLTLMMYKTMGEKRNLGTEHFWYSEELPKKLQNAFLPKLDEMLNAQGFILSAEDRQIVVDRIASFQKRKSVFAGLFGK